MGENKTTICWNCSNYSKCNWSVGKVVDGWDAERVFIKSSEGQGFMTYIVKQCPNYMQDKVIKVTCKCLSKLLGEDEKYVKNALHRHGDELDDRLEELGYKLRKYEGDCYWWLERLD